MRSNRKILITEVEQWEREAFHGLEQCHEVVCQEEPISAANADQDNEAEVI